MVSKKSESMIEKMVTAAMTNPRRAKTERSSPAPRVDKSGRATSEAGRTAWPGAGKAAPPVTRFTTMASAVLARIPMSSPPLIPRAWSQSVRRRPNTATATGDVVRSPRVTGTPGGPGFTIPAEWSPMNRMKSPIPTPMARFSASGIAPIIASRKPVSTSTVMARPSSITTPMAACHGSLSPATS